MFKTALNGTPSRSRLIISDYAKKAENTSKVVDENGEPLVVWHGSSDNNFSIFDKKKIFKRKDLRSGFFFAPNSRRDSVAGYYGEGNERAFFLNLKNPLMINPNSKIETTEGYDGIISIANEDLGERKFYNYRTDKMETEHIKPGDIVEIIAFEPTQIKSATDNNGKFGINNPDIYNQAAYNSKKTLADWLKGAVNRVRDFFTSSVESSTTTQTTTTPKSKTSERDSLAFENSETERRYRESQNGVRPPTLRQRINRFARGFAEHFSGDYAELGRRRDLYAAREEFRNLDNRKSAAAKKALRTFNENLGRLNEYENELFGKARLLDDLAWRKKQRPEALLPFGFDDNSLRKEHKRFSELVEKNPKVKAAIEAEERTNRGIVQEFTSLAKELGYELDEVFSNPHYYRHIVLNYANAAGVFNRGGNTFNFGDSSDPMARKMREILGRDYMKRYKGSDKDISTDYTQANYEVRTQMMIDIETMKSLIKIKNQYDKMPYYRQILSEALYGDGKKFNQGREDVDFSKIIPEGYEVYNPAGLVKMANSPNENIMSYIIQGVSESSRVPFNKVLGAAEIANNKEGFNQSWFSYRIKKHARKYGKG